MFLNRLAAEVVSKNWRARIRVKRRPELSVKVRSSLRENVIVGSAVIFRIFFSASPFPKSSPRGRIDTVGRSTV